MADSRRDYLPPGLWYALVEIAMTNGLALKEVQVTLLRHILEKEFGFKCNHPEDKIKIKNKNDAYCKHCWTRLMVERTRKLDPMNRSNVLPAIYRRKHSFLDRIEQISEINTTLEPDQRGGE